MNMGQIEIKIKNNKSDSNRANNKANQSRSLSPNFSSKFIFFLVLLIILIIFVLWLKNLVQIFNLQPQKDQLIYLLEQSFSEINNSFQESKQLVPPPSPQSSTEENSNSQILNQEQIKILKDKVLEEINH